MRSGYGSWPNKRDTLERRLTMFGANGVIYTRRGIRGGGMPQEQKTEVDKGERGIRTCVGGPGDGEPHSGVKIGGP